MSKIVNPIASVREELRRKLTYLSAPRSMARNIQEIYLKDEDVELNDKKIVLAYEAYLTFLDIVDIDEWIQALERFRGNCKPPALPHLDEAISELKVVMENIAIARADYAHRKKSALDLLVRVVTEERIQRIIKHLDAALR